MEGNIYIGHVAKSYYSTYMIMPFNFDKNWHDDCSKYYVDSKG